MDYKFLKDLSQNDLLVLIREAKKENDYRMNQEEVIYQYDCKRESDHHHKKYKHWAKVVEEIDDEKSDDSAFVGKLLSCRKQELVRNKTLVVECHGNNLKCYRITKTGKKLILCGSTYSIINFIRKLKEELEK